MNDRQQLEARLEVIEVVLKFLDERLIKYREEYERLTMELNRLRRLEREELQNE